MSQKNSFSICSSSLQSVNVLHHFIMCHPVHLTTTRVMVYNTLIRLGSVLLTITVSVQVAVCGCRTSFVTVPEATGICEKEIINDTLILILIEI